jgi:hypothetical protein
VEYYSAIKRNELLIRATAQVGLETVTRCEGSQTQKDTGGLSPLTRNVENRYREKAGVCQEAGPGVIENNYVTGKGCFLGDEKTFESR